MRWIQGHRGGGAVIGGLVLPVVVTAALIPLRTSFAATAAALVLVAVIVAIAVIGSRDAGFVATVSASVWFDFFLTQPYDRFAMTHRSDIETAISLFVVGMAVTELAVRNRRHHERAVEQTDYVGVVYYLAELVASGVSAESVIERANAELTELLNLRSCRYESTVPGRSLTQIAHDGTVHIGEIEWGAHHSGLPGKEVELRVQSRGHERGCFVMGPTPGWPVSLARRLVAVAIADQVGGALVTRLRIA